MKSSLWTAAALGLALTLGACTDGNLGNLEVSSDSNHPLAAPPVAAVPQQLVQLMAEAPEAVVFQGTRRYEAYWDYEGSPEELIYREDVVTNGQGGFSIDPAELISPPLSSSGEDIFLLLQKTREGFFFGHRDFSIRDLQLFLKQWTVLDLGQTTFLGRSAVLLDVRRQDNPDGYYLLTVDDQNGLVLRAE